MPVVENLKDILGGFVRDRCDFFDGIEYRLALALPVVVGLAI